jgi:sensor histidine kinase YesM
MEVVESYLAIQQIRFEERLSVETTIDPSALDGMVPLFLLQPIVENAIRHGISHRANDGVICTSAWRIGDSLQLQVKDNGPGSVRPSAPGHGIGLKNTRERLAHLYPSTHEFVITQPDGGGFEVTITIPYERASR